MIAKFYGRSYSRQFIRQLCEQDRQGTSFATLSRAAEHLGFRTLAVRLSFEDLKEKTPLPCIAFWANSHFVVVRRVSKNRVHVADPSSGFLTYTRQEFEKLWLNGSLSEEEWGYVLILEPSRGLLPDDQVASPRPNSTYIWQPLWADFRRHVVPLAIGASLSLLVQLAAPFLSAALVDRGIIADSTVPACPSWNGPAVRQDHVVNVAAPVLGTLLLEASVGTRVKQGQRLARILAEPGAASGEVEVLAPVDGLLIIRASGRLAHPGVTIATILADRPAPGSVAGRLLSN